MVASFSIPPTPTTHLFSKWLKTTVIVERERERERERE
jgi:hypothetical protein